MWLSVIEKQAIQRTTPALSPLGTVHRPVTRVDELANQHFDRSMKLDPLAATLNGLTGYGPAYPDYGPQGRADRAQLRAETLRALDTAQPADTVDQVTIHALRALSFLLRVLIQADGPFLHQL